MAKVIDASCVDGVVTALGLQLPDVEILSEGEGSSVGIVIIDVDKSYYVASNALDIKALLESLDEIIGKVVEIATSLDAVTVSPGTAASAIAQLSAMQAELALTQETLR